MEKKYLQIGNFYIALHYGEFAAYIVRDEPDNLQVKMIKDPAEVENIESYTSAQEITEELFVEKFSGAIDYLHNNTPYA